MAVACVGGLFSFVSKPASSVGSTIVGTLGLNLNFSSMMFIRGIGVWSKVSEKDILDYSLKNIDWNYSCEEISSNMMYNELMEKLGYGKTRLHF